MDQKEITDLFDRYLTGQASPQEIVQVEAWLDGLATVPNDWTKKSVDEQSASLHALFADIQQTIQQATPVVPIKRRRSWMTIAAAAVLILVVGIGAFFYVQQKAEQRPLSEQAPQRFNNDLLPGSDKAILTLANGKQIILDSTNGNVAKEGGVAVINLAGQLSYESAAGDQPTAIGYHTVATPRGGQYQLVLSDGTRVWLNAASSLRFPTAFAGNKRIVELTGEGYFEVAHKRNMPFHVKVGEMDVQVLGTHFNINSYADEGAIRTTLLEGSVKVTVPNTQLTPGRYREADIRILKPGEQAIHSSGSRLKVDHKADLESAMAWKNGRFSFQNADLETIMRQMARWYDVEVVYEEKITDRYTVNVSRDVPVSQLFKFIEMSGGVDITIEGKKVIVRK